MNPIHELKPLGTDQTQPLPKRLLVGSEPGSLENQKPSEPSTLPSSAETISKTSVTELDAGQEPNAHLQTPFTGTAESNSTPNAKSEVRNESTDPQPSTSQPEVPVISQPSFSRSPGETPRAFTAFTTYYRLGRSRSLQGAAEKLGEQMQTVKNWSCKFEWNERIIQLDSGLLQTQIDAEKQAREQTAAEWAKRDAECRQQEWENAQHLHQVVQCWFQNYSERDLEKMRLSELSRAVIIASQMSRSAVRNTGTEDKPTISPLQAEMLAQLGKIEPQFDSPTTHPTQH